MGLSDDERNLLEKLMAKDKEDDPDDKFEIEIYDTKSGHGARVPYKHGRDWLYKNFGIGQAPKAPEGGAGDAGGQGQGAGGGSGKPAAPVSYFGSTRKSG